MLDKVATDIKVDVKADIKDVVNPGNVIDRICNAIGLVYKPIDIIATAFAEGEKTKIVAKAKADEDKILARTGGFQLSDIQKRALNRLLDEETRKQENMEALLAQVVPRLKPGIDPQLVDLDVVRNFFAKGGNVSDPTMQGLWAELLGSEINEPGTVSSSTLDVLAKLTKADAERFESICRLAGQIGHTFSPFIFAHKKDPPLRHGLTHEILWKLQDLGLIVVEYVGGRVMNGPGLMHISHGDRAIFLDLEENDQIKYGEVYFTLPGQELYLKVVNQRVQPTEGFLEYLGTRYEPYRKSFPGFYTTEEAQKIYDDAHRNETPAST